MLFPKWKKEFGSSNLSPEDRDLAWAIIGGAREPDLVISPDGNPYLYRWFLIPRGGPCNVYFHIQVADDPERPLHDHPWDNQSVILSGGYTERLHAFSGAPIAGVMDYVRVKGDVIQRKAEWSHRLFLPPEFDYTMTLFSTGPKLREWGFWFPDGWVPFSAVTKIIDGQSVHVGRSEIPVQERYNAF